LGVTLNLGSSVLTFTDSDGVDMGDYVGEFVHQQCRMVVNGNWRVFFRPDRDGKRDEIVIEYGRSTVGPINHVTLPYTATVTKLGSPLASFTVNRHWWGGRWRFQSSPRPVVRPPATLKARRWVPNFGHSGLFDKPIVKESLHWQGPMTPLPGVDAVMGTAGDHDQIGYLTEHAADYMIRPSDITLESIRAEGEWIGNACIHLRNDDGSVLDIVSGTLNYVGYKGTILDPQNPKQGTEPSFVYPEVSHTYPCATAGWLLTDDPYLLEELQFMCNWVLLQYAWAKKPGILPYGQTRAFAWGLRDLFTAAATTPSSVPKWLLGPAYFQKSLDANLAYSMQYVNSPARIHALFRVWTRTDICDAWMSAWLTAVVGMAVEMGFVEWKPVFEWAVGMQTAMSDGGSGWNRQVPAPYEWYPNRSKATFTQVLDASSDATVCRDWADAWNYFVTGCDGRTAALHPASWDGHTFMSATGPSTNAIYQQHLRSALAVAVSAGIPGAEACYDYIHGECAATNKRTNHFGQARFSIDPLPRIIPAAPPNATSNTAAWVPEPGQYADIPTTNLANDAMPSFYPRNADPIFVNWSGAAYVPEYSALGAMVYEGGGHGVVRDGKLILDLSDLKWKFSNASTQAWPETTVDQFGARPDGSAFSPHTFHGVQAFPATWGIGPKGGTIRFFIPGSSLKNAVWAADISQQTLGWRRLADAIMMGPGRDSGSYPITAIDDLRKGWWVGIYSASDRIVFFGADRSQTVYPVGLNTIGSTFTRDPLRDVLVRIDTSEVTSPLKVWELDCKSPKLWVPKPLVPDQSIPNRETLPLYRANPNNRQAPFQNGFASAGLEWSSILKAFVMFADDMTPRVWIVTPGADSYNIRMETLSPAPGTGPVAYALDGNRQPLLNGNWSKFREVPALRCFVWAAAGAKKPQAFRLRGM
jgi:hypothetical protein